MARGGRASSEGLTIPELLHRRNYERVFAFHSKNGGLAAFLRPVKTAPPNEQEDRARIRVALEDAFGRDESSVEYYTRTLASDAAHELRRLIEAKPVSSKQLSSVISNVHALRNCLLTTGTEKGFFTNFLPLLHATFLAALSGEFEGPARILAFLQGAQRLPEGAVLPKICKCLFATGRTMLDEGKESPALDKLLKDLDLLTQLYLPENTISSLTTILDTLALDHTWHDRMDQLEADVRSGKLVDYDNLRKKGQEMIEKGEWIQSSKKVNKKYIRDDKKNMKKGTRPSSIIDDEDDGKEGENNTIRPKKVKRKVKNWEDPPDVSSEEQEKVVEKRRSSRDKNDAPNNSPEEPIVIDDDEDDERRISEPKRNSNANGNPRNVPQVAPLEIPADLFYKSDDERDSGRRRKRSFSRSKPKVQEKRKEERAVPPLEIPTDIDEQVLNNDNNRTPVPSAPRRRKRKGPMKRKYRPGQDGYVDGTRESEPSRRRGLSTPSKRRRRFSLDPGEKKNLSKTQQMFVERFAVEETQVDDSIDHLL